MNKRGMESTQEANLRRELRQLRKGTGLTVWKLHQAAALKVVVTPVLGASDGMFSETQLHAYLLYLIDDLANRDAAGALKSAYAIGQEIHSAGLTQRRLDFSLQIGRHPDTVKAYENQAIEEIVHRLLSPASKQPLAWQGAAVPPLASTVPLMEKALQKTVAGGLGGLYELGSHSSEVLRIFGQNTQPYLDANVECLLMPSSRGSDWYTYRYRYTFRSPKAVFRIGVVTSPRDCGVLIASGLFDEMCQLNENADFNRELPGIIGNCRFVVRDMETDAQRSFWFTELDAPARRELLGDVWQIEADECRVIELQLPASGYDSVLYELRIDYDLRVGEHYAYWETPGLMYLNTITIDVSQFPERDRWQFFFKPFLGTTFTGTLDPGGNRFTLPASSWVTAGHGVAIIWQEK